MVIPSLNRTTSICKISRADKTKHRITNEKFGKIEEPLKFKEQVMTLLKKNNNLFGNNRIVEN